MILLFIKRLVRKIPTEVFPIFGSDSRTMSESFSEGAKRHEKWSLMISPSANRGESA